MKKDISHMLEKAAITGVTSAAVSAGLIGTNMYYQFPGASRAIPLPIVTAALGVVNSVVTDGIHTVLHKAIPLGKKTADRTSLIANAAVSGATFFALLHLLGSDLPYQYDPLLAFATGAVGEASGSAIYEYLTNNLYI